MGKKFLQLLVATIFAMICLSPAVSQAADEVTDMVILLDRSGSMNWPTGDPDGLSRAAVEFLLDQLELANPANRVALILFASSVKTIPAAGLTSNFDDIRSQLTEVAQIHGDTDLEMALSEGLRLLAKSTGKKEIVLISDGQPDPDPRNANSRVMERYPELYESFHKTKDRKKKDKIRSRLQAASIENISRAQLGALHEAGIEIYPIGLSGIQALGEELMQEMAIKVTQDISAFKKVKGNDIVSALDTIVPKPESLITVRRDGFKDAGCSQWSTEFKLNSSFEQVRLLILYDTPPADDATWRLEGPNGTMNAKQLGSARYLAATNENGAGKRVFERLFLDRPARGNFKLTLDSPGFLPPVEIIVEGRTNARIIITSSPSPGEVGLPLSVFCRLEGGGNLALTGAEAQIINSVGQEVARLRNFTPNANNILSATWMPASAGEYKLKVLGYTDPELEQYLRAQWHLQVQPKQAVHLSAVIPTIFSQESEPPGNRKKGASFDPEGGVLEFGVLAPGRQSYIIEKIEVAHDSKRSVNLSASITGLRQEETNAALDPEKWFRVKPLEGSASQENPWLFNLEVHFPKKMPGGIPDGLYTGRLKITSKDADAPLYLPFRFTMNLPDFTLLPEDLLDNGLDVAFCCCIPGSREISFSLLSDGDSMTEQVVKVVAPVNIVHEESEKSIFSDQLNVVMADNGEGISEVVIPPGKKATEIKLLVNVINPVLAAGQYNGKITIRGDYGRTIYLPLSISIPETGSFWVDKYKLYFAAGAALMFLLFLLRPFRLLIVRRKCFQGDSLRVDKNGKFPGSWNSMLSATNAGTADQDRWRLTTKGRGTRLSLISGVPADVRPGGAPVEVTGRCRLNVQARGNNQFELSVSSVTGFSMQLTVARSPFQRGRLWAEGLLYLILLSICAGSVMYPQIWCSLFPFLA